MRQDQSQPPQELDCQRECALARVYNLGVRPLTLTAAALVLSASLISTASAQQASAGQNANKAISTTGTYAFLGLGLLLPLVQDGDEGVSHFLRAGDGTAV